MTASRHHPLSLRHLRYKSGWGWLLALCWLLLNTQLAVAGHRCGLSVMAAPVSIQHDAHRTQQSAAMSEMQPTSAMSSTADSGPLCEKHCLPDSANQDLSSLSLLALPASTELLPVQPPEQASHSNNNWFTPPVVGPPAEIRFCRFRE
ncbi:hypothetical protein [Dickeya undicola]|uniref:DUF2946 domain-containing protein n=1 Tax=Dickeya undicola TaxID=1577887 RepID=A0A3N0FZZ9_9GAMM|nr:hypothetical protein [Dickeya undicola]RNM05540.1 hypothetical protein EF878_12055 [Dickeya undicola]RNM21910.1 hypothetical protein EFS38_14905 [Dickeya undicola]